MPPTEQELLSAMWGRRGANDQACPTVPEGVTARDVYAEVVKKNLGEQYGQDFSHYSTRADVRFNRIFPVPEFLYLSRSVSADGVSI